MYLHVIFVVCSVMIRVDLWYNSVHLSSLLVLSRYSVWHSREILPEPGTFTLVICSKECWSNTMWELLVAHFVVQWPSFVGDEPTPTIVDAFLFELLDWIVCLPIWLTAYVSLACFASLENEFPIVVCWRPVFAEPSAFTWRIFIEEILCNWVNELLE